jgi:hypothetical protein
MVAVARYIPDDPKAKESVLAVLREHPELQDFIARVSEKAAEMFPDVDIALDTEQYDDWDPPLTMKVRITQPWDGYKVASRDFARWVGHRADYDRDLILVMPMWNGPLQSHGS